MGSEHVVGIMRQTMETALWMGAPAADRRDRRRFADQRGAGADFAAGDHRIDRAPAVCGGRGHDRC